MIDDIRRPREESKNEDDFQIKQESNDDLNPTEVDTSESNVSEPETSSVSEEPAKNMLYESEGGFAAAQASSKTNGGRRLKMPHHWLKEASKKQKIIGGVIGTVLILSGSAGAFFINKHFNSSKPEPAPVIVKKEAPPKPTTEASKLTGVQISPEVNKRPIYSVQIENSPDARPQAGIKDAGVIYEAIAEGGITRFNVNFLEGQPDYIGPVRSVRPYYAVLAAPFDPVFIHAGGSAEGLRKISELRLKDMDHGANGNTFRRASDRYAPHNLYTSTTDLDKASQSRGYTTSDVKPFARKTEKASQQVTARAIDINFSSAQYNTHYDYDPTTNSYKRSMGGRPHTDHRSGVQITPKVVVAIVSSYSQSGIYSVYQTTGTGKAFIFQDGIVQEVTWSKAGDKEQYSFLDAAGKPVALNAGQTWIGLVKAPDNVGFTP